MMDGWSYDEKIEVSWGGIELYSRTTTIIQKQVHGWMAKTKKMKSWSWKVERQKQFSSETLAHSVPFEAVLHSKVHHNVTTMM